MSKNYGEALESVSYGHLYLLISLLNPRGGKYSREIIFAFLRIAEIAKFCAS